MLKDLRHGVRMLLHTKGWTAVVLLSLALGIGANTALFSAVNGVVISAVPVPHAGDLVRLRWSGKNDMRNNTSDYGNSRQTPAGEEVRATVSYSALSSYPRRQSDAHRCPRVCADGQRQRRRERQGGAGEHVAGVRQLLHAAQRAAGVRTRADAGRRSAIRAGCGGDQLQLLGTPVRPGSDQSSARSSA